MNNELLKGKWALVTGASSGLGASFARDLASRGCNLVVTARREDRLNALQEEIIEQHRVSVKTIPLDLTLPTAPENLYDQIEAAGISVDVLINNAGFGIYGEFLQTDWTRHREMLQLNILAVTHLTLLIVRDMAARNSGYILNVASYGAYQPSPMFATYGASKSYVLNFSEALHDELKGTQVKCTAISPGPVVTEFQQIAGQKPTHPLIRFGKIEPARVTRIGIDAVLAGRASVIPGWKITLLVWSSQLAPRRLATFITGWLMRLE
jgi:short-subunit dehydrogenase